MQSDPRSSSEKIQTVQKMHQQKKEQQIKEELEQHKTNTKNYINLTKEAEKQREDIDVLKMNVKRLESSFLLWKRLVGCLVLLQLIGLFYYLNLLNIF